MFYLIDYDYSVGKIVGMKQLETAGEAIDAKAELVKLHEWQGLENRDIVDFEADNEEDLKSALRVFLLAKYEEGLDKTVRHLLPKA
jgi:hypothetical protein